MATDPYRYFRVEARELIDQLGGGILELERGGGAPTVQRLLRQAHTLKGAARVVRQIEIADHAHTFEDALAPYREGLAPVTPESVNTLLGLVDAIARQVAALDAPQAPASTPASTTRVEPVRTVRAEVAEMDALVEGIIETHARLGTLRTATTDLDRARHLTEMLIAQLARHARGSAPEIAHASRALAEEIRGVIAGYQRSADTGLDEIARELGQVRDSAEQLRLTPAGSMFSSTERTVRDAAHELGKQVRFEGRGGDVRLDAHVLATVQAALVQLARNAVAHGIESAAGRRAAGKAVEGSVTIEIARRGRRIVIACRDDGRGVDLAAVRRVALRRGVPVGEQNAGELVGLLLQGGITTSHQVTEVAGRGIGLDVVREVTVRLGGEVTVQTAATGTTFELVLPMSLSSVEALLVEAGGITAAIPIDVIKHASRVTAAQISRTTGCEAVVENGRAIPFLQLSSALRVEAPERRPVWIALVLESGQGTAMLAVDRLHGVAPVVVRPIPDLAAADPIVAGAALDADGNPQLVLDPDRVIALAQSERPVADRPTPRKLSVLVIDDSLTTRMLEQSILESAGYDVDTAVSGEQGLEAARAKRYSLFLVDVEMPGIDGFTFVERVRADPDLRHIPAILVTSRAAPDDRRRGEAVGAHGYIVKSEFDQADLLARIEGLVR